MQLSLTAYLSWFDDPYLSFSAPGSIRLVPFTNNFNSSISHTAGRVDVFYNGEWGTVCGRNVNKATADALCANVTGDVNSLALAYGTARSHQLR